MKSISPIQTSSSASFSFVRTSISAFMDYSDFFRRLICFVEFLGEYLFSYTSTMHFLLNSQNLRAFLNLTWVKYVFIALAYRILKLSQGLISEPNRTPFTDMLTFLAQSHSWKCKCVLIHNNGAISLQFCCKQYANHWVHKRGGDLEVWWDLSYDNSSSPIAPFMVPFPPIKVNLRTSKSTLFG